MKREEEAEKVEEEIPPIEKEEKRIEIEKKGIDREKWKPKTKLGREVKENQITNINDILDSGQKIVEPEIIDALLSDLSVELLLIGQAKGKFGGGQRRTFRQTQKKSAEGNKPSFGTCIVVGNHNGIVGVGYGKARETVPAREKALRQAKLNLFKIRRGCGSWQCGCKGTHSIPFAVEGKTGSCKIKLMPAPKGTGLKVAEECQKILVAAGVKDVWSKTIGLTTTRLNLIKACEKALRKLMTTKLAPEQIEALGVREGAIEEDETRTEE